MLLPRAKTLLGSLALVAASASVSALFVVHFLSADGPVLELGDKSPSVQPTTGPAEGSPARCAPRPERALLWLDSVEGGCLDSDWFCTHATFKDWAVAAGEAGLLRPGDQAAAAATTRGYVDLLASVGCTDDQIVNSAEEQFRGLLRTALSRREGSAPEQPRIASSAPKVEPGKTTARAPIPSTEQLTARLRRIEARLASRETETGKKDFVLRQFVAQAHREIQRATDETSRKSASSFLSDIEAELKR